MPVAADSGRGYPATAPPGEDVLLIENEFEVPAPIEQTWEFLLDVERVAPCAPGAELTETVDERTWKGRINLKLGPVSLSFAGTVHVDDRDDAAHRIVLGAKGQETRGKGAATATVTSWLGSRGDGTLVKMQADITLTGTVAQLSRGLLPDVSRRLTAEFAECLRSSIEARERPTQAPATTPAPSEPPASIGGIRLGAWAIWHSIVRFVGRVFGRR
jgi:carbon monoxide dehydrogenase subunit G